ncbi:MAG: trypsin-like peptidase domain-containing protein, partial [Ktedonobacterales bacterium]|nr:trypsin-like peptidase domain-containing protein [Ktedonobacterales bacterium]
MFAIHADRQPRARWRRLAVAGVALLALTTLFALTAHAASGPGGDLRNPVILNAQIARPAVVRIFVTYDIEIDAPLCGSLVGRYSGQSGGTGSGAFISSHGDILTAGHVVSDPIGDVTSAASLIAADLQKSCRKTLTPDEVVGLYVANPNQFTLKYSNQINSVYLSTAYVGLYSVASISAVTAYPFTVSGISPEDQNDVAIIHINLNDSPTLPLGDSANVSPTDTVTEIGFPGNGDLRSLDDLAGQKPNNFFTDSVNFLTVSAVKTNDNGGALLQVGGNVEHGDSGGPVLNAAGEIVGVVSFSRSETADTHFMQASSSVRPLLGSLDTK